jgi:putative phosphoesterase
MKVVVFSDVHGNLPALDKILSDAGSADAYVCLGDNVNYGPWSEECVRRVDKLNNVTCIMGNHEESFIEGDYLGTHLVPKLSFSSIYPKFRSFDTIKNYLPDYFLGKWRFVHTLEGRSIYPDTELNLQENVFIGHSHHQFQRKINGYTLINVGSVGQNRKYINIASYGILDTDTNAVQFCNVAYDVQSVIDEMRRQNFPAACLAYYENKQRLDVTVDNS